ncbi:ABC transporter substrate-binding protein [Litorilinea aerophila]|nr:ABC transporter substrate-binding protein [Litorilinea aerophila]MCC9076378.1 ABC transporter substrate-binding protein [Litorilinea aerophila]
MRAKVVGLVSLGWALLLAAGLLVGCGDLGNSSPANGASSATSPVVATNGANSSAAPPAPTVSATLSISRLRVTQLLSDTLVVAMSEDAISLDPARATGRTAALIHKATYQTLVTWSGSPSDPPTRLLAESWEVSPDGLTYTFQLDARATFASGNPVTGADVVFSFNRLRNGDGVPAALAANLAEVTTPDPATVVLTLAAPDPDFLFKLAAAPFSVLDRATILAQVGGTVDGQASQIAAWLNSHSAGSGPYQLERWTPGIGAVLVRNEAYWRDSPALSRVVIRHVPYAAAQALQLAAGDVDLALDLRADQVEPVRNNPDVSILTGVGQGTLLLAASTDPELAGPLADPAVVRAMRHGVDYAGIRQLVGTRSVPMVSILPVGHPDALGVDQAPIYDPELARNILLEAGYQEPISATLSYPDVTLAGVPFGAVARKVQSDLNTAGFRLSLSPQPVPAAFSAWYSGQVTLGLWYWRPAYGAPSAYLAFLPGGTMARALHWTDETADETILTIRDGLLQSTEGAARREAWASAQRYLLEQGPYVPLVQPGVQIGLNSQVQGIRYHPQWWVDVAAAAKPGPQ